MKILYTALLLTLSLFICSAQKILHNFPPPPDGQGPRYFFGIVHLNNYDFKIVAIANFGSDNTDVSDIGFTLLLPAGNTNIINEVGLLDGRSWSIQEFDASYLSGEGLGDGTRDAFQFNLPVGQSIFSHTYEQQIDLVSFTVSNSPMNGELSLLPNGDAITIGIGGVLDSFYNSIIYIENYGTIQGDYYYQTYPGMGVFPFSTLDIENFELLNNLNVYPNPSSEYINIESKLELNKVSLHNILGEKVLESFQTKHMNIQGLSAGIYFLNLFVNDQNIGTKKVIIK